MVLVPNSCWLSRDHHIYFTQRQAAGRACQSLSCYLYGVHWTNAPPVKGQLTSHQTCGCQLSRQIRAYLNLELKICLKILSNQVLWLRWDPSYSKVKTHYCKHQYTTRLSSEWQLDIGFLRAALATNNLQHSRGNRGTPRWWELSADAAHPLPFHTSAPKTPLLPAPQGLFPLPQLGFAKPAASHLFSHPSPLGSETPGWRRRQNDKLQYPSLKRYARVEGGISLGQSINCVALPSHPTFVSAFCCNTCKPVTAEVLLAAES